MNNLFTLRTSLFAFLLLLPVAVRAASEPMEIPLWPKGAPGSEGKNDKEVVKQGTNGEHSVYSVHNPSITPYLPPKSTGTAVIVIPGSSRNSVLTKEPPPVFLGCAYNDRPDISEGLANVYLKVKQAGVPAELHIYSSGGHGFGLRSSNRKPVGTWIARFEEWLADSG